MKRDSSINSGLIHLCSTGNLDLQMSSRKLNIFREVVAVRALYDLLAFLFVSFSYISIGCGCLCIREAVCSPLSEVKRADMLS